MPFSDGWWQVWAGPVSPTSFCLHFSHPVLLLLTCFPRDFPKLMKFRKMRLFMYILIKSSVIFQFTTGFVCIIQPVSSEHWAEGKEYLTTAASMEKMGTSWVSGNPVILKHLGNIESFGDSVTFISLFSFWQKTNSGFLRAESLFITIWLTIVITTPGRVWSHSHFPNNRSINEF